MPRMSDTTKPLFREHLEKEIAGVFLLAFGVYTLLCLISFNNFDPSFNNNLHPGEIHNYGGVVGAHLADLLLQLIGLPAILLPLACFLFALRLFKFRDVKVRFGKMFAFAGLILSLDGLIALQVQKMHLGQKEIGEAGGAVGRLIADPLLHYFNLTGATLILLVFFVVTSMLVARFSMVLFLEGTVDRFGGYLQRRREQRLEKKKQLAIKTGKSEKKGPIIVHPEPVQLPPPARKAANKKKKEKEKAADQETFDFLEPSGTYHAPTLTLLDHEQEQANPIDRESLTMNARLLEKKLKDFGVEGEVVEVKPGPVVTMYEFLPAPGVKVNKVAGLVDDLTLALSAHSIRIVAPIPGRGVIGIEIPNRERETIFLKDILQAEEYAKNGGILPLALGKDIFGRTTVTDLAKMPHLLVAGSTGSGKSVSVNTMILSLVYRHSPNDVRMIMIDPKMIELSIYEGIPHLLLPVVTNPKKAALALAWAVREMERRYTLLADKGVRNIEGYNKKIAKEEKEVQSNAAKVLQSEPLPPEGTDDLAEIEPELDHQHLPYIVVMVDELADLMMVAGREIEESVARLAQKARACGIHLILATQRPSVDVITGLIKANFPTRMSFQVVSRTDSRTILDQIGAENLLGKGDMLFLPPGTGVVQRIHGAFVTEIEVQRVVDFLKKQGDPNYDPSILKPAPAEATASDEDEEYDEKWDEALAIIADTRQASISMLQRRLRLGYNRAARMIEKMEQEGIVGPSDGTSRPREVFINRIDAE